MIGQWPAVPVPPYRPKSQHRGSMSTEEDKIFAWLNGTFSQVNFIHKKGHFLKLLTLHQESGLKAVCKGFEITKKPYALYSAIQNIRCR